MPSAFAVIMSRLWNSPHLLLVLATVMWGGHTIVARVSVGEISPMVLMEMRWVGCLAVLLVLVRGDIVTQWPLARARIGWTILMGGVGLSGFTIFFIFAAQYTSAVNLGITQSIIPAFVMILNLLFLGVNVRFMQVIGLLSSLLGVLVLVSGASLGVLFALQFNSGDLLMLVACLAYASYTVGLSRRIKVRPLVLLTYFSIFASITHGIGVGIEFAQGTLVMPGIKGMIIVLYCVIFPSLLAQILFMRGVELAGANRAGLHLNLIPIFSALMAILFLRETMHIYHAVSLVMVLGGIYLVERHKKI